MSNLIDRQAAIDALLELYEYQRDIDPTEGADLVRQGVFLAEKRIERLPSAQPKRGRWIRHNTYHGDDISGFVDPDWRCSECGKNAMVNEWMLYDLSNFCPNCGAKMEGE